MNRWSAQDFSSAFQTVEDFERRGGLVGSPSTHPFNGCELTSLSPLQKEELRDTLGNAQGALAAYRSAIDDLTELLGLPERQDADGLSRLLGIGERAVVAPDIGGVAISEFRSKTVRSGLKALVSKGEEWRALRVSHKHLVTDEGWDADVGWAIDTLVGFEDSIWLKPSQIDGSIDALKKAAPVI